MHKKSGLLATLIVIFIVAALAASYFASGMPHSNSTSASVTTIDPVVPGAPSGIPCAALGLPCAKPTSISASLVLFEGKYYYVSNIAVNSVTYTIWYVNSTYY